MPQVFDVVVSVFAPCPAAEFRRVLRCGGSLVVASPGPAHLAEFRDLFYDAPQALPARQSTDPDMQVGYATQTLRTSTAFALCAHF